MKLMQHSLAILTLCAMVQVFADNLEEIVVTGSRITGGYTEIPAVTLRKKADYLVQAVRFVNDSRSPDLRKQEIIESVAEFLKSAGKTKGIELSYGEGFLLPIDLTDDSLQLITDRQRIDTNYVNVYVKSNVNASKPVKEQIAFLRTFIKNQKLTGRTEIETQGDIGLSIVGPEQYRYEILKSITEENQKIRKIVGTSCAILIGGLEGRVDWERTSVDELTLYIPYGIEVECDR